MNSPTFSRSYALALALFLTACGQSKEETSAGADASSTPDVPVDIVVPAGQYELDTNHAQVAISVQHLGLSNYVIRFTDFGSTLSLADPIGNSSITLTIDPTSVDPMYTGDYTASHPDSPFSSWREDLAQSEKFLNASEYPEITFESTAVERDAGDRLTIEGNLTLLGVTKPVVLEASVVGQQESHPFTGAPAIAFSATGSFDRSEFGMTHLLQPPLVSDEVTLRFEGEFNATQPSASGN